MDGTGLDEDDAGTGQEFLPHGFRPAVHAPRGGGIDAVPCAGGAGIKQSGLDRSAISISVFQRRE